MNQNWNFMCADCHSTNLRRNYDLSTNSYHTTWSDIDVVLRGLPRAGLAPCCLGQIR